MPRFLGLVVIFAMAATLRAQQPAAAATQEAVASPTQAETLAKWPWSISLQSGPF